MNGNTIYTCQFRIILSFTALSYHILSIASSGFSKLLLSRLLLASLNLLFFGGMQVLFSGKSVKNGTDVHVNGSWKLLQYFAVTLS